MQHTHTHIQTTSTAATGQVLLFGRIKWGNSGRCLTFATIKLPTHTCYILLSSPFMETAMFRNGVCVCVCVVCG